MTITHHVFQITQTTALMCLQLPRSFDFDPVAFLDRWQTLLGAAIGGFMGVAGALIVASRATRRERRIAAGALLPELQSFRGAYEALATIARASKQPKAETAKRICRSLVKSRPVTVVLHSPALGQLSDIDAKLYSHLYTCQMIHGYFEQGLAEFADLDNAAKAPMPATDIAASEERLQAKAGRVMESWILVAEHASAAEYYLDRFIFRRWPVWVFKLRMRFCPNELDRRSTHLIETGEVLAREANGQASSIDPDTNI